MYLYKNTDKGNFYLNVSNSVFLLTSDNCNLPLRVYLTHGESRDYVGIVNPDGDGFKIEFKCHDKPDKILVVLGRIDDKYDKICEFNLSEKNEITEGNNESVTEKFIFSHPATEDCVRFYGHYFSFNTSKGKVLAFPSDFFSHPLLHLIPYSYWYPVSFGNGHTGYYLIGITKDDKPFFVNENVLSTIHCDISVDKKYTI